MANLVARSLTLSTLLVGTLSMSAHAQVANNRVLVIDEGVDLQHKELTSQAFANPAEQSGVAGVDDDRNGFVDDVSGWNAISNDASYFPQWVRKMFVDNVDTVGKLLALYNRVEEGDQSAIEIVRANPNIGQALNSILGLSHGTHVGGIVVRYGNSNAQVASLNVFTQSQEPAARGETEGAARPSLSSRLSVGNPLARMKRLIKRNLASVSESAVETPTAKPFVSQFDDTAGVTAFLAQMRSEEGAEKRLLSRYILATRPRVANLSLGSAKIGIRKALDSMWEEELITAKLPLSTQRTALQEQNFQRMLNETFEIFRASWNELFRANSGTLFVIAAGNDADDLDVPNAGNNGINEVLPANCSKDNANVITIAASTPDGLIADFSNYHSSLVNVAAWGTAVPSLAPNNNTVKMSGTSMASPYAAGLASKLFSVNIRLTPSQTRQIMEGTVKKIASLKGRVSSDGMVDPQAALDAARRTLLTNNVEGAIRDAVQARNTTLRMPQILGRALLGDDETRVGQVHKTPDLVKAFMR
jgi:hypothetical protein